MKSLWFGVMVEKRRRSASLSLVEVITIVMDWGRFFTYSNGLLVWRERPASDFKRVCDHRTFMSKSFGNTAGSMNAYGYIVVSVSVMGTRVIRGAHRVIWEMHNGPIPAGMEIDHINGVRNDNRIENLRLATPAQNKYNSSGRKDSSFGLKGVTFIKKTGKWRARIGFNGTILYLGEFKSPQEASAAYASAAKRIHGDFFRQDCSRIR